MQDIVRHLQAIPLLQGLPEEAVEALAAQVTPHQLRTGDILFRKGDEGNAAYVIHRGWVKIVTENEAGEELVLNHCGPGEVVGEMALIDREPRSAGIIALGPVEALELKRDAFLQVLSGQPMLALDIMRNFSARLRFSTTYIEKAIAWSRRIAAGDYHVAIEQIESDSNVVDRSKTDDSRANELLAAFFEMVEGVREREETLKQQVRDLSIEIDESRRRQAYEEVAESDFFKDLKSSIKQIRQQNTDEGH